MTLEQVSDHPEPESCGGRGRSDRAPNVVAANRTRTGNEAFGVAVNKSRRRRLLRQCHEISGAISNDKESVQRGFRAVQAREPAMFVGIKKKGEESITVLSLFRRSVCREGGSCTEADRSGETKVADLS